MFWNCKWKGGFVSTWSRFSAVGYKIKLRALKRPEALSQERKHGLKYTHVAGYLFPNYNCEGVVIHMKTQHTSIRGLCVPLARS